MSQRDGSTSQAVDFDSKPRASACRRTVGARAHLAWRSANAGCGLGGTSVHRSVHRRCYVKSTCRRGISGGLQRPSFVLERENRQKRTVQVVDDFGLQLAGAEDV